MQLRAYVNITHELKARQEFTDKSLNDSFKQIHRGFFTERELKLLIDGKDFWMGKPEILERWANHKAARLSAHIESETPAPRKPRGRPRKS